jgi:tetratricopeptide (TPR) repeat protein
MTRSSVLVFLATLLSIILFRTTPARACGNAVFLETSDAVAKLREAEDALANGDVVTAHNLAWKVRESEGLDGRLHERAVRIATLATIRDPNAHPGAINFAASDIEGLVQSRKKDLELVNDPAIEADYGEALERAGRIDEAFAVLAPLAEKDLIGSAYAYAALSRAARQRGAEGTAKSAYGRCLAIAASPDACNRIYPRASLAYRLVKGTPAGYFAPALVFLATIFVARRLVRRKERGPLGAAFIAARAFMARSWRRYALAIGIVLCGALAFTFARYTVLSTLIALGAAALTLRSVLGMKSFVRAVSLGDSRTKDFTLRDPDAEDPALPAVSFFFFGPATLERTETPAYREGARTPLLRVVRRPAKMLAAIVVFGALALFVSLFFLALFATMRGA